MVDTTGTKTQWHLLPMQAIAEVVAVLTFGAKKHGPRQWEKGMSWDLCYDACLRHLLAWWGGEDKDPESGCSHLAHAVCNLLFLIAYGQRGIGQDTRPNSKPAASPPPKSPTPHKGMIPVNNDYIGRLYDPC